MTIAEYSRFMGRRNQSGFVDIRLSWPAMFGVISKI